ncbi:hypothetical protein P153DRAFT_329795 [Dothidotthia symphoricarpi CBS 119687]|uniref:BTB domain-containing protein n=1 Tax=Dothidotthia symphoricarpi CBS 119687 TaxID=1392245 RepID=A0A6A6ASE7_9PLEO|nr:uncharacterized protein P153DRAFT_329795 [Dothidotthia symphoricarpi CBS 119687]KAF2134922.1 hypothetical protein P153DRAFT_329795 [Dothidotthia symphoricarpi CBS 119687]
MADVSQKQLLASFKGLLKSGAYSDLTVTCGDDSYKVHRVIVCERADFFARAIKFGGQKEAENRTIDLPEDDPDVIKLLIQYLYEGEYEPLLPTDGSEGSLPRKVAQPKIIPPPSTSGYGQAPMTYDFPHSCEYGYCNYPRLCPHHICGTNCRYTCNMFTCQICSPPQLPLPALNGTSFQLVTHAKVYEMADKYDVVGLKALAVEKLSRACEHFWDHDDFAVAANYAFSTTMENDRGLRDLVSTTISKHIELVEKPEIKVLLSQFNGLALGILEEKIKEHGWGKKK